MMVCICMCDSPLTYTITSHIFAGVILHSWDCVKRNVPGTNCIQISIGCKKIINNDKNNIFSNFYLHFVSVLRTSTALTMNPLNLGPFDLIVTLK